VDAAKKKNRKRRVVGRMILSIRKELIERGKRKIEIIMTERIKYGKGNMRVVRVYVNKDLEKILEGREGEQNENNNKKKF